MGPVHLLFWILRANGIRKISCKRDPNSVLIPTASTFSSITMQRLYAYSSSCTAALITRRGGRHLHNAFHCAKCTETCHRSLCNYFLQTLKSKRRPENKFGVAALFSRFTTKRIPFARNFVQMGSHMFSSAHRFATIFCRL